jgi:FkbM family methyltransferase
MIFNTRTGAQAKREQPPTLKPEKDLQSISVRGVELKFTTPNRLAKWRVDTLLTKEPETVAWINCFKEGDIFVDVGANVGMYTVYAAAVSRATVYAFEPESQNYSLLNENIYLNALDQRVRAFPMAISDRVGLDVLNLSTWGPAGSCHSAGEAIAYNGEQFSPKFVQGTYTLTLDHFSNIFTAGSDVHLKIDVDGIEPNVINGATNALREKQIKSVLVEINHNLSAHLNIVRKLLEFGYVFDFDQVKESLRKDGPFAGVANYVFCRH